MEKRKLRISFVIPLVCTIFKLDRLHSGIKKKTSYFFCYSAHLHYLCGNKFITLIIFYYGKI